MSNKKKIVIIASIIALFSVVFSIVSVALNGTILPDLLGGASGGTKYDKPSIGEIAGDGAYPDEVTSDLSANAQEKEWYEYITYSKTPVGEIKVGNKKLVFYDPYDYDYGMVMEINALGDGKYSNGNSITVSQTSSVSHSWSGEFSSSFGYETSLEASVETGVSVSYAGQGASSTVGASVGEKFVTSVGFSVGYSGSVNNSTTQDVTYNAVYFNASGVPYQWRLVQYTVYLPLYCEAYSLVNGKWVLAETNYCLLTTLQGTCREWVNNVAYYEDWRTGEPIQVENFWKEFFIKDALINAYKNQMIPEG